MSAGVNHSVDSDVPTPSRGAFYRPRPTFRPVQADPSVSPPINVTTLSQYVRLRNCDRFLRFRLRGDEERAMRRRWGLTIQPLTPLLEESGAAFERAVEAWIEETEARVVRIEAREA